MPRKGTTGLKGPSLSEEYPAEEAADGGLDPAMKAAGETARFAAARRALLDVETPADASSKASEASEAAKKLRGFAWEPDELGLPPHFPVRPLGKRGGHLYFMDPIDQLVDITASKLSQQGELDNLFSPNGGVLWAFYAQMSQSRELRIKYEDVRRDLITACGRVALREGVFDPAQRVRGRGAWRTDTGVLVLHLGDKLWVDGEAKELGELDGYVYPREETLPAPIMPTGLGHNDPFGREAGRELLEMLKTWRFERDEADLDARLVLGWIVCVMLGGALEWRPQIFMIGDRGTGKSTLQRLLKSVLGRRLLNVADATGPGIYQTLGQAAIGVAIDEFENEGDDASESNSGKVLKLARLSSSGDRVVRGGQDGVPSTYEAQGVFGFSAINMLSLKPAELSRMAVVAVRRQLDPTKKPPKLTAAGGEELGRRILGRVASRWHEWPAVLEAWRSVVMEQGQDSRVADQFGTLLAAAHLATADGKPLPAEIERVAALLQVNRLSETKHAKENWERCVDWLLSAQPEAWRGKTIRSVGAYLGAFVEDPNAPRPDDSNKTALQEARERLAQAGLAIVLRQDWKSDQLVYWLAVPANHAQVGLLFKGSTWGIRAGAESGTWSKALMAAPAGVAEERVAKIDGVTKHCIQLNLDRLLTKGELRAEDEG